MKRFAFVWMIVLCLLLTACGGGKSENTASAPAADKNSTTASAPAPSKSSGKDLTVDLSKHLSVGYNGYNTNGSAYADFHFADFEYEVMSQWDKDEQNGENLVILTALENTFAFTVDKPEGLSNGDTISICISLDEQKAKEYGYHFTGLEKTFTVEGLVEPIYIDPFAEENFGSGKPVDVTLEGVDPFVLVLMYNCAALDDPLSKVTYRADKDWNLKNGDVINFTATLDEKFARQGYVLSRSEYQIPVEGFDRYVSDPADLTADVLQRMKDRAMQECVNGGNTNIFDGTSDLSPWGVQFENVHVGDTALLVVNNNLEEEYSFVLVPVYQTIVCSEWYDMNTGTTSVQTWENVFSYFKFTNVRVLPDGTVTYEESYVETIGNFTDDNAANLRYLDQYRANYSFLNVPLA